MFKKTYNRAKLELEIEPVTPFLIMAGREGGLDPTLPQMQFVRTHTPLGPSVVIPGSSLKGVIRSQAERTLRTTDEKKACDPLGPDRCSARMRNVDKLPPEERYANLCHACRTFGSTAVASRVRVTDALPWSPGAEPEAQRESLDKVKVGVRAGVAIDRASQAARSQQLFDLEVVTAGKFYGEIFVTNFQLWQLALVGMSLRDIDEGYQQLGMGKTRGLGRVRCRVAKATLEFAGVLSSGGALRGIGAVDEVAKPYQTLPNDECGLPEEIPTSHGALGLTVVVEGNDMWRQLLDTLLASKCCDTLREKGETASAGSS